MARPPTEVRSGASSRGREMSVAVRTLVAFALVAVATSLVVRGFGLLSERFGSPSIFRDRLIDLKHALPQWAARDEEAVLLVGDSVLMWGVRPELVDEALHGRHPRMSSYNVGIVGLTPDLMPRVVHLIATSYREAGKKPAAIVIALSPLSFSYLADQEVKSEYALRLDTPRELASRVLSSPEEGLRVIARRYGMGGFSGAYLSSRFSTWLNEDVPRWFGDQTEAEFARPPRLTVENKGSPYVPGQEAAYEAYFKLTRPTQLQLLEDDTRYMEDQASRILDEPLVEAALMAIYEAQATAARVVLVSMPRNPCARFSPKFEQRWKYILSRLEAGTGAPLLDFSSGTFSCDEFFDLAHLEVVHAMPRISRMVGAGLATALETLGPESR